MGTPSHESTEHDADLPGVLVTPSWLYAQSNDANLRILDVRQPELYARGHIAGAHSAPLMRWSCTLDDVEGMLLPPNAYATFMARLGVSKHSTVVVYDDTWGMAAARLFWSLEYYGHRRGAVLNGGWDLWRANGLPVDAIIPNRVPSSFTAQPDDDRIATYQWLKKRLSLERETTSDLVVVDTRSRAEYDRGHVPGAVSWDWINATPVGTWEAMRDADELRAELCGIGVTPDKEVVVYCRSGVRAAHTYLFLRRLGYPRLRNYDGSWLEWEARSEIDGRSGQAQPAPEKST